MSFDLYVLGLGGDLQGQLRYTQRQNVKHGALQTDGKGYAIGLYVVKCKFFIY